VNHNASSLRDYQRSLNARPNKDEAENRTRNPSGRKSFAYFFFGLAASTAFF
jgi:hypothetical protein